MQVDNDVRLSRAKLSLEGLSIGDAFGERFFVHPDLLENLIAQRAIPTPPWRFTDDTMMAMSIFSILRQYNGIVQDWLALSFAHRYDSSRGYGPSMHGLLDKLRSGEGWKVAAKNLFAGQGSYGNGAAMRVAPIGAYFADDLDSAVKHAHYSAEITHTHPEAIAGAIAVAVASAWACRLRNDDPLPTLAEFLDLILPLIPKSEVSSKIRKARDMGENASVQFAISVLGNSSSISAQDTVPFALWCAAQHLRNYEEALWLTVSGEGDRDTTCAIVGGIVVNSASSNSIPQEWLDSREPLPDWPFQE
ncbi:MAG: ADP-ribosylglycohydrolase family protein [Acidobacteriota bacterium]